MKFSELKEKWRVAKEKINNSMFLYVLLILSFIIGFTLTMISIPIRIIVYVLGQIANLIGVLIIMGATLGFFFTPHITIYRYLWMLFVSGCLLFFPALILELIDYLIKLSIRWVEIFIK